MFLSINEKDYCVSVFSSEDPLSFYLHQLHFLGSFPCSHSHFGIGRDYNAPFSMSNSLTGEIAAES